MGLMLSIVSRFRKRATTKEVLEGIDEDIKRLESTLERNQKLQKKIVLSLLTFSILIYCIAVAVFYFILLPDNWSDRAIWILPFVSFPLLVYLLKRCFHFFFVTRIKKIGQEIEGLKERKKGILEDVTENETYKVAKELLEKFDPDGTIIKRDFAVKQIPEHGKMLVQSSHQGLRLRTNKLMQGEDASRQMSSNSAPSSPHHGMSPPNQRGMTPNPRMGNVAAANSNGMARIHPGMTSPRPPMPRFPILPMERSVFDKVAEYFVGDGPSYRYALICKACHGHNGMALKDEFEYIAFKCCYCGAPNPARKSRPNAPPLEDSKHSDVESDKEKLTENESGNIESGADDSKEKTEENIAGKSDENESDDQDPIADKKE